jgi:hypothetical protein
MNDEMSRKAVLILVVIAVVISILSTTLVMNMVSTLNLNPAPVQGKQLSSSPAGVVRLTVPPQPTLSATTGRVVFSVDNKNQ